MMKKIQEVLMIAVVVGVVTGVYFKWMGALPISVTQTQKISTFDVSGEGKVVVIPDQAVVSLGLQETGSNLKQVQEEVNKKMASIAKALKEMGIAEKDIKTTGYNFYPDWQVKNKYSAHASIEVVVREMDKVSPVMDLVGTLGLDNVSGPTFGLSDELTNKTVKEARGMAIDKAKAKAEELANLAGMKLGRIVNITEGQNRPQNYLIKEVLPMTGGGAVDVRTPTPVEPGSSEVMVSVSLSYETR